jgi:hypothetical protein
MPTGIYPWRILLQACEEMTFQDTHPFCARLGLARATRINDVVQRVGEYFAKLVAPKNCLVIHAGPHKWDTGSKCGKAMSWWNQGIDGGIIGWNHSVKPSPGNRNQNYVIQWIIAGPFL